MPFCTKCGFEYRTGIVRCPECSVPLVESRQRAEEQGPRTWPVPVPDEKMVVLREGIEPAEAEVMREVLEREGISASVRTSDPAAAYLARIIRPATRGGCTLMVAANQSERANRVLADAQSGTVEWPEGMEPEED